jgi:hypothetical protein
MRTLGARVGDITNINVELIKLVIDDDNELIPQRNADATFVSQRYWIAQGLKHYCMGGADEPGEADIIHVLDYEIGIERPTMSEDALKKLRSQRKSARLVLEKHLTTTWHTISTNRKFWTFDVIIKMFSLDDSAVDAAFSGKRFLLMDEAQDLNGVMRAIAEKACRNKRVLVAVGDPWQQIYSWNGAENALDYLDGETLYLTQSFRFGEELAELATNLLRSKPAAWPKRPILGNPARSTEIRSSASGAIQKGDTVICRTNAGLLAAALQVAEKKMKLFVVKGLDELLKEIRSGVALYEKRMAAVKHPNFKMFEDWQECKTYAEEGQNETLQRLIRDIENGKIQRQLELVQKATVSDERRADVVLSTAHKTKGREYDYVSLWSDFPSDARLLARYNKVQEIEDGREAATKAALEEWHVKYVAMTRGIKRVVFHEKSRT